MRTKIGLLVLAGALAGLLAASVATAAKPTRTTYKLTAALNRGQETTKPKGTNLGASGRFTATLNATTGQLSWTLSWRKLSGPAVAAHIHNGKRGVAGAIVVPLCPTPSPCTSPTSGTATLTADQVRDILAGRYYANIHTAKNPGGEIRGQITKAPVP